MPRLIREDAEAREPVAAIRHDRPVAERRHVQQPPPGLVRQHDLPRAGVRDRHAHELEIERPVVVQDVQHVLAADDRVGRGVLDALAPRPDRAGLGAEVGCRHEVLLGRDRRSDLDHEVALATGEARADPVPLVAFVEESGVGRGIRSHLVQPHGVRPPRVIHRRVDDEAPVGRERGARRGVLDDVVEVEARGEVADAQRVALVALMVDAIQQPRAVGGDIEAPEREELVSLGFDVAVEEHDLARHVDTRLELRRRPVVIGCQGRPTLDAVLLALDRATVVPP